MNDLLLLAAGGTVLDLDPTTAAFAVLAFVALIASIIVFIERTTTHLDELPKAFAIALGWPILLLIGIVRNLVVLVVKAAKGEEW